MLAKFLKLGYVVASMAVKDKEPLLTLCTTLYVLVEVLDPFEADLIVSPAILAHGKAPVL